MVSEAPDKIYIDRLDAESRDVVLCFKDTEGENDIIYIREDLFTDITAERDELFKMAEEMASTIRPYTADRSYDLSKMEEDIDRVIKDYDLFKKGRKDNE